MYSYCWAVLLLRKWKEIEKQKCISKLVRTTRLTTGFCSPNPPIRALPWTHWRTWYASNICIASSVIWNILSYASVHSISRKLCTHSYIRSTKAISIRTLFCYWWPIHILNWKRHTYQLPTLSYYTTAYRRRCLANKKKLHDLVEIWPIYIHVSYIL